MKINNINFKKNSCGGWLVLGDTERFGKQKILFEGINFKECLLYLEKNGCNYTLEHAIEKVDDLQISNKMYHRVYRNDAGEAMGYSNSQGWQVLNLKGFELVEPLIAKRTRKVNKWTLHETLKLGNACAW